MTGFSRSEFIFKNNEPHLLEINTVPGLTNESILPQQAAEAGISMMNLFYKQTTKYKNCFAIVAIN